MCMYALVEEGAADPPRSFPLPALPVTVGRSRAAPVRLADPSVSREHARLFEREGRLYVADLNARNGTFVNGKRVTLAPLEEGDELRLGRVRLRVERSAAPPADTPAKGRAPHETRPGGAVPPPVQAGPPPPKPPAGPAAPAGAAGRPPVADRGVSAREIRVKEDLLRYQARRQDRGRSLLGHDFSQYGGGARLLLILFFLALAAGTFFLFQWIGRTVVPEEAPGPGDQPPGYGDTLPGD